MALVFDAAADRALRTTDLPNYNAAYTWMAWFYPTAPSGTRTLFSMNDNGSNYDFIGLISGNQLYVESNGATGASYGNVPLDAWSHICVRRDTAMQITLLVNGVAETPYGDNQVSRPAASRLEHGGFTGSNANPFQGRIAYSRLWSAALNNTEINTEKDSAVAVRITDLYADWRTPLTVERLNDFSGNARHFSEVGSLGDAANPFGSSLVIPVLLQQYRSQGMI